MRDIDFSKLHRAVRGDFSRTPSAFLGAATVMAMRTKAAYTDWIHGCSGIAQAKRRGFFRNGEEELDDAVDGVGGDEDVALAATLGGLGAGLNRQKHDMIGGFGDIAFPGLAEGFGVAVAEGGFAGNFLAGDGVEFRGVALFRSWSPMPCLVSRKKCAVENEQVYLGIGRGGGQARNA